MWLTKKKKEKQLRKDNKNVFETGETCCLISTCVGQPLPYRCKSAGNSWKRKTALEGWKKKKEKKNLTRRKSHYRLPENLWCWQQGFMLNGGGSAKELRRSRGKRAASSCGWASIKTLACHTLTAHEVRHLGSPLKPEWLLLSAAFLPTFLLRQIMTTEAPTSTESAATAAAAVGSLSWPVTHTGHHLIVFVCYRNSLQPYQSSLLSWLREPLLTFYPCPPLPPPLSPLSNHNFMGSLAQPIRGPGGREENAFNLLHLVLSRCFPQWGMVTLF